MKLSIKFLNRNENVEMDASQSIKEKDVIRNNIITSYKRTIYTSSKYSFQNINKILDNR